jgi:hypothetical protein
MLLLEASTHRDFHDVVSAAADAIAAAGGWIVSHQFFSKSLAAIAFQIPASALHRLGDAFSAIGIKLHHPVPEVANQTDEISVHLAISFVDDGSDFRRAVPTFG